MNVKAPSSAQAERKRAERGSTLLAGCIKRWRHRTLTGRSPSATVVEGCWLATIHGLSRDLQRCIIVARPLETVVKRRPIPGTELP